MRVNAGFVLVQLALTCVGVVYAQTPVMPSDFPDTTPPPGTSTSPISEVPSTTSPAFPTLSGVSPCITDCFALAVSASNCTSLVDVNCFCNNEEFSPRYMRCVATECPDQAETAEFLAGEFCSAQVPSSSLSDSASDSTSSGASSSSSPTSGAPSPTASQDDTDDTDTPNSPDTPPDGAATSALIKNLATLIMLPVLLCVLVNVGLPL